MSAIAVSVVVPVFNEQENLPEFVSRIEKVMGGLSKSFEVIFVDDGSTDQSFQILKKSAEQNPAFHILRLSRNFGQHAAIFAGFEKSRGSVVVTLDADLQNPPEEIPKFLEKMDEGYEVVGGYRQNRQDSIFRKIPTFLVARIASRLVKTPLKDYGCMLRAYRRELVDAMLESGEVSTYIPALANSLTSSVAEIPVAHSARTRGKSKYSFLRLLHLNFDLMTSFSLLPIQLVGICGVAVAFLGFSFSFLLIALRLVLGVEWAVQGVLTVLGILFFFVGVLIFSIGLMGEYVGRIYQEVKKRPRYRIKEIVSRDSGS